MTFFYKSLLLNFERVGYALLPGFEPQRRRACQSQHDEFRNLIIDHLCRVDSLPSNSNSVMIQELKEAPYCIIAIKERARMTPRHSSTRRMLLKLAETSLVWLVRSPLTSQIDSNEEDD